MRVYRLLRRNLFLASLFLLSCAGTDSNLNPSLIRDYSFELQREEPFEAPFISIFEKGHKTLAYIAANHTDKMESPTFKLIKDALTHIKPDYVIVEGMRESDDIESFLKHSKKCFKTNEYNKCGEVSYTAFLSHELGIPFSGAEPSDIKIAKQAVRKGLEEKDIAYFYLLRISNQWKRQGRVKDNKDFEERARSFIPVLEKRFKGIVSLSYSEFLIWYKSNSGESFDLVNVQNNDLAPIKNGVWSQHINHVIGLIRERNIVEVINDKIKNNDTVLIVYGAGHLVKSRLVLERFFGKARRELKSF